MKTILAGLGLVVNWIAVPAIRNDAQDKVIGPSKEKKGERGIKVPGLSNRGDSVVIE